MKRNYNIIRRNITNAENDSFENPMEYTTSMDSLLNEKNARQKEA